MNQANESHIILLPLQSVQNMAVLERKGPNISTSRTGQGEHHGGRND